MTASLTQPASADGPKMTPYDGKSSRRPAVDGVIATIAAEQHGVVALDQLVELGLGVHLVDRRVKAGRLHRVHHGVFAVGHANLTRLGRLMAAVLACGPDSVLSHRSAAELWKLRGPRDHTAPIDVTASNRRGRAPLAINAHRDAKLALDERTSVHGIPCTTTSKTLLDFAAMAQLWELRKAVSEAEVLGILDLGVTRDLIRRHRGRRGVAKLRLVLDDLDPDTKRTRSELERMFLRMCREQGLPRPEVNVRVEVNGCWLRPDFLWRDLGLIAEADGRRFHGTRSAFQRDRRRDQLLQAAGWIVCRCTWEQVEREPRALGKTLQALLMRSASRRRAENGPI